MAGSEQIIHNSQPSEANEEKGNFASDVLNLVSGTTLSELLIIFAAPFLARLYGPEAFGISTLFVSITGILTVVSCLRYENSILLPDNDEEAANLMVLSFLIGTVFSILIIPVVLLAGPAFVQYLKAPELMPFLWLVPIIVFFGGTVVGHPALTYWVIRSKRFRSIALTRVINKLITLALQLGIGYIGYASGGSLIGGVVIGSIISTLLLSWWVWRDEGRLFRSSVNWQNMFSGLKRYRKFPLFDSWAGFLNTLSWQIPAFLLSAFFSPVVVGYYSLGNRLLKLPMNLIGSSIGQVFFQRAAYVKSKGPIAPIVENVFKRLVMLGMFPMLLLSIIGRDLFIVVFGEQWAEAGVYVQILSVWIFFWFISYPLSTLFNVLEKQEFNLFINIAILVTRVLSLWLGGWFGNARLALLLFSVSGIFLYGYMSLAIIFAAGVSKYRVLRILFSNFLLFVPGGLILLVIKYYFFFHSIAIVAIAFIILGMFLIYIARTDPEIKFLVGKTTGLLRTKITKTIKAPHEKIL